MYMNTFGYFTAQKTKTFRGSESGDVVDSLIFAANRNAEIKWRR